MSLNASECRQCLQSLLSVLDAHARESRALDECASLGERVQMRAGSTSEATSFHFEAYRAILTGDPLLADLEQALGGCSSSENVQRDLTALGNLVFQYATSSKSVAFWLWELGLRADERNALYSYAQVLRETDNAGSLTSLVSSMFERASALGHPYATYSIGLMASTGELPGGVNLHKAREYFEKAVEMEVPLAYTNLGRRVRDSAESIFHE